MNPSQVSISLQKLKKCNLVMCLNDKSKKGRIYQATDLGVEVIRIIEKQTRDLKK
jgi:DNA-binding PadR family transcriptional regulator